MISPWPWTRLCVELSKDIFDYGIDYIEPPLLF
jgi:hypothetical protein